MNSSSHIKIAMAINIFLRGMTLLVRFIFLFIAAKYMSLTNFALYGLLIAIIAYSTIIIGLEFHTYTHRELVLANEKNRLNITRDSGVLLLLSHFIFLPIIIILISITTDLPSKYYFLASLIIITEHISLQISRLLIAASLQIKATFVLMLRSGVWCFIAAPLIYFYPIRSLEIVLILWVIFSALSIAYGLYSLKEYFNYPAQSSINWTWIKKGITPSLTMFFIALTNQGFFVFDRLIIDIQSNPSLLASYILFISASISIISLVDAGIVAFFINKIILATEKIHEHPAKKIMIKFSIAVFSLATLLSISAYITTYIAIVKINKPEYIAHIHILPLCITATFFYCLNIIPHTILYAYRKEQLILKAQLASIFIFVLSALSGIIFFRIETSVPFALLISMISMFVFKSILVKNQSHIIS